MERLKKARKSRDLSQSDLAKLSRLVPSSISHFESGRREPSLTNFKKLCVALECSADELLGIVPDDYGEMRSKLVRSESKLKDIQRILNRLNWP